MGLDYSDVQMFGRIHDTIRDGQKATLDAMRKLGDANAATQADMAQAFNRVATALESLAKEVKGLREDLSPNLDKPAKLSPPAGSKP